MVHLSSMRRDQPDEEVSGGNSDEFTAPRLVRGKAGPVFRLSSRESDIGRVKRASAVASNVVAGLDPR